MLRVSVMQESDQVVTLRVEGELNPSLHRVTESLDWREPLLGELPAEEALRQPDLIQRRPAEILPVIHGAVVRLGIYIGAGRLGGHRPETRKLRPQLGQRGIIRDNLLRFLRKLEPTAPVDSGCHRPEGG